MDLTFTRTLGLPPGWIVPVNAPLPSNTEIPFKVVTLIDRVQVPEMSPWFWLILKEMRPTKTALAVDSAIEAGIGLRCRRNVFHQAQLTRNRIPPRDQEPQSPARKTIFSSAPPVVPGRLRWPDLELPPWNYCLRGAVSGNPGFYGRCLICSWTPGTSDSTPRVPLSESTLTRTSIRSGPTPVVATRSNTRLESSGSRFHHPPVSASTTTPINPVNRISRTRGPVRIS